VHARSLLLRGARPWGSRDPQDVLVRDGRIEAVAPHVEAGADVEVIDAAGGLLLPGLVDGHGHLDKTLWGAPWQPHSAGPTVAERIANERRVLDGLGLSPQRQSARLLRRLLACGTTHLRSHVDIAPGIGLRHLDGVLATVEEHRDWIEIELVAFPQEGVMRRPGTLELLEQAVQRGVRVLGGLDPIGIDGDPTGQLDAIFAIAGRHGCAIDIHLHDRGEDGATTIERIAERTAALGLRGRVAISHAFCLGTLAPARLDGLVELLVAQDIAVMTHAPAGDTPFPPVRRLGEAGVRLFSGSDGVRDTWTPLNTGDMLERAYLIAYRSGFRDDAGLELALRMVTHGGAQVLGARDYGLHPGAAADLVLVEAGNAAEAVALHPRRRLVLKRGRVVARDGECLLPPA
jgi:cytosine/adenosine deaminase-related metal-dependent hydrolase